MVLLTGSELSVCNRGIVPGETFEDQVRLLTPANPSLRELLAAVPGRVNDVLGRAVPVVRYVESVRALVARSKPVAITEFGCCTYKGAADRGAHGADVVEWDAATVTALRLDGDYTRDEDEQAAYLRELLDVFTTEGVDSAFVYTFARWDLPHREELGWTWTWPAPASSRSWRAAAAAPTPTWRASPRPPSPRWPTPTGA